MLLYIYIYIYIYVYELYIKYILKCRGAEENGIQKPNDCKGK